ncbi:MAG: YfcC family protein [Clostridia bacterium]|nr:YfcC family protein [Clostridia bacterium]
MKHQNKGQKNTEQSKSFSGIETRSFAVVVLILCAVLAFCGLLSYLIPQGEYARDEQGVIIEGTFEKGEVKGIAIWRVLTAPARVFASEDALTIIMISVFLLIMSGIFNLLEKTGGIKVVIGRIMHRLRDKGGPVVCVTVLLFMLFGSFFGMFEELVTLLPIIIVFLLSMNMDTMTGLGACLLAACFGFSAAITNPFSVGLAAEVAGIAPSQGAWLRVVFFGIVYVSVCFFLMAHLRKIERDPTLSPTYEIDLVKRESLEKNAALPENSEKVFRVYASFFAIQAVVLILIASVRAISSYAIVILAASFLIFGILSGLLVSERKRDVLRFFLQGAVSMLPAVLMIALASSAKLIMTESGIMDTIMHGVISTLEGKGKYLAILLIYLLIFFLQFFIGSASAKIFLVMPIIMPVATALGISPSLVILAYCMADGFTDVILPTNPILLIGLSMANVSYAKWVKWTWKLQLSVFALSILTLFFGVAIGY